MVPRCSARSPCPGSGGQSKGAPLKGASNQLLVAGVEDMTGGKRQVLVPLGESCTNCALGASEQHGRVAWARVDHDYSYQVRELDGALITEDKAPFMVATHGPPTSCTPQLFELKKAAPVRCLSLVETHTLASLQGDNVWRGRATKPWRTPKTPFLWMRRRRRLVRGARSRRFPQRLAPAVEACLTFADGLVDSVKDVFQPTASSKALKKKRNAVRYGFDKIAVVMK